MTAESIADLVEVNIRSGTSGKCIAAWLMQVMTLRGAASYGSETIIRTSLTQCGSPSWAIGRPRWIRRIARMGERESRRLDLLIPE